MSLRLSNAYKTTVVLGLALSFGLALSLASAAAAQRPRPKPPTTTTQAPTTQPTQTPASRAASRKLIRVEDRLQSYATAEARRELGDLAKEKDAEVLVTLGRILEQEKAYRDAEQHLREAGSLAPQDPAPWAHLAFAYFHQKREAEGKKAYQEAANRAQAAVKKDPKDAAAHYYLGTANVYLGNHAEAETHLERARKLSSGDPMPAFQLGMNQILQEKWSEGVALFTEALQMDDDLAYAYYYRGQAASRLGKKDMLIADLKRFLDLAPEAPEAPLAARTVAAAKR